MKELTDLIGLVDDPAALRERLSSQGHLFFRGLLDPGRVMDVRGQIATTLARLGWIDGREDPMEAVVGPRAVPESPDHEFIRMYREVQSLQAFHELGHDAGLVELCESVLGAELLVHPRKIVRIAPPAAPEHVIPPHQDYPLIQGATDVLTVWVPLGPCPEAVGGLRVLAGSHRRGLARAQSTQTGGLRVEADDDDPDWTTIDFETGDVLLFHSLTIHAAKPNRSRSIRISADFRYQALTDPLVEGSLLPHYGQLLPSWDVLTAGWSSTQSVATPPGAKVVPMGDPFADDLNPAPSRIVVTYP